MPGLRSPTKAPSSPRKRKRDVYDTLDSETEATENHETESTVESHAEKTDATEACLSAEQGTLPSSMFDQYLPDVNGATIDHGSSGGDQTPRTTRPSFATFSACIEHDQKVSAVAAAHNLDDTIISRAKLHPFFREKDKDRILQAAKMTYSQVVRSNNLRQIQWYLLFHFPTEVYGKYDFDMGKGCALRFLHASHKSTDNDMDVSRKKTFEIGWTERVICSKQDPEYQRLLAENNHSTEALEAKMQRVKTEGRWTEEQVENLRQGHEVAKRYDWVCLDNRHKRWLGVVGKKQDGKWDYIDGLPTNGCKVLPAGRETFNIDNVCPVTGNLLSPEAANMRRFTAPVKLQEDIEKSLQAYSAQDVGDTIHTALSTGLTMSPITDEVRELWEKHADGTVTALRQHLDPTLSASLDDPVYLAEYRDAAIVEARDEWMSSRNTKACQTVDAIRDAFMQMLEEQDPVTQDMLLSRLMYGSKDAVDAKDVSFARRLAPYSLQALGKDSEGTEDMMCEVKRAVGKVGCRLLDSTEVKQYELQVWSTQLHSPAVTDQGENGLVSDNSARKEVFKVAADARERADDHGSRWNTASELSGDDGLSRTVPIIGQGDSDVGSLDNECNLNTTLSQDFNTLNLHSQITGFRVPSELESATDTCAGPDTNISENAEEGWGDLLPR